MSSTLFNCLLEEVFRKLEWSDKGVSVNGSYLNNLRFADDIVLIAPNLTELEEMINELAQVSEEIAGLLINIQKTKILSNSTQGTVKLGNQEIQIVDEYVYLGQLISMQNQTQKEINRRISITWKKFWTLKHILKGPFSYYHKSLIFNSCILPTLTYGAQTWACTKNDYKRIATTQNAIERAMLGVKLKDKIHMTKIKQKFRVNVNAKINIKRQKWKWAGHVARMKDDRWAKKLTFWYLGYKKRRKGRQKIRWSDDINALLQHKMFHRIAQDRFEWDRLQEAYAQDQGFCRI